MDRKREASHFLGEILAILPTSLQELRAQCTRQGIEDFPQVETLLSDGTLSSGLHRDWRKAVFRLLDFIFKRFDLPPPQSHSRLDFKLFPTESFPGFVFGIVSKYHMKKLRKERFDLVSMPPTVFPTMFNLFVLDVLHQDCGE